MVVGGLRVGLVLVAVGLGGCTTTMPNEVTHSTGTPATAQVAGHTSPQTAPCRMNRLAVVLGPAGAAAGTEFQQIEIRNLGATACVLNGYPSLVFLDKAGRVVGGPAQQVNETGTPVVAVSLAPGATGHASMGVATAGNYPASSCRPRATVKIRFSVPGDPSGATLASSHVVCSTGQSSTLVTQFAPGVPTTAVG